jgi:hypothetical protein
VFESREPKLLDDARSARQPRREAARYLKVSLSWLAKARLYGTGPVYRKVGRSVRYLRSDLERYLAARVRTSTAQI